MDLMSLPIRSLIKASVVLTRTGYLFIHNYIRSLLNIIVRPILLTRMSSGGRGSNSCPTARVSNALPN